MKKKPFGPAKPFAVTIEHGIPIPPQPRKTGKPGPIKTTLTAMQDGDSFVVATLKIAERVRHHARDLKLRIAIRKLEDGTYRVWHQGDAQATARTFAK